MGHAVQNPAFSATDCYRKGADGLWVLHPFAGGETVELASVVLTISAATLFAEV